MTIMLHIRKAPGTWSIRAGGAVLGESSNALEVTEGDRAPVLYFPRADVAMAFLEPTAPRVESSAKGTASMFSIVLKSATLENSAWSYETPIGEADRIAGYIAFDTEQVTVEET